MDNELSQPVDVDASITSQEQNKSYLNWDSVRQFVSDVKENASEKELTPYESFALRLVSTYAPTVENGKTHARDYDKSGLLTHKGFVETVAELKDEIEIDDPLDMRIFHTNVMALHYLLVSGELRAQVQQQVKKWDFDTVDEYLEFAKTQAELESSEVEFSKKDHLLDLETDIVYSYLERVNKRWQEPFESKVTLGFEYEYIDETVKGLVSRVLSVDKKYLQRLWQIKDLPTKHGLLSEVGGANDGYADATSENISRKNQDQLTQDDMGDLEKMALREIQTNPDSYYKRALREYLYQRFSNDHVNIHETYGGIKLDKENTQVMDMRAILEGAGYTGMEVAEDGKFFVEDFAKVSVLPSGETVYFPFMRVRGGTDLQGVGLKVADEVGVEFRSDGGFDLNWQGFTKQARRLHHEWLATNVIVSVQTPEDERSLQDQSLVDVWEEYLSEWNELLSQNGILNLPDSERYVELKGEDVADDIVSAEVAKGASYNFFLSEVNRKANSNPEFRRASRKIITTFNKKAKDILTLKEGE